MVKKKPSTMMILFKSLMRTMGKNIKQLISIIAISFLAICLFSGLTSNAYNIQERQDNLYEKTNLADVYVTTTGLTDDDRNNLKAIEGIEAYEERIYQNMTIKSSNVYLIATAESPSLSHPLIIDGKEGFLMMDTFMNEKGYSIGDKVTISMSNPLKSYYEELDDNAKNLVDRFLKQYGLLDDEFTADIALTGSMYHPEGVQNSSFSNSVISLTYEYLSEYVYDMLVERIGDSYIDTLVTIANQYLFNDGKTRTAKEILIEMIEALTNQVVIKTSDSDVVIDKINEYFSGKDNFILAYKNTSLPSYQALNQDVTQAMKLTFVFPVIFFLVSLLVILTTLSQMILKSRGEIGTLKALGIPKRTIYLHYISFGVVLCFIGSLLGFIVGPLTIPNVMGIKYNLLWDMPKLPVKFFYLMSILMIVALIVIAGLCSFILAHSVVKEKPAETLRTKVPNQNTLFNKFLEYRAKRGLNPISFGKGWGVIGICIVSICDFFYIIWKKTLGKLFVKKEPKEKKNTKTKQRKGGVLTNFWIVFKMAFRNIMSNKGKSIMVVLGMMGCTALLVCGFGISDTLNYGIELDYNEHLNIEIAVTPSTDANNVYNKLIELDNIERVEKVTASPVSATAENSVDTTLYILEQNSSYFQLDYYVDGGVTINKTTAENMGLKIGDEFKIVLNGTIYERKVTYIFESSVLKGIYDVASSYSGSTFVPTTFYIFLKDKTKMDETKEAILGIENVGSCQTKQDFWDRANSLLSTIDLMTDVIKLFAILLCVVVIYNLTSLNIAQRKRDIATMKVLGFHYHEISMTLALELAFDSLAGSLLGLLLGFPLAILVLSINKTQLLTFLYFIKWSTYLISFSISFVTSIVVSLILNLKAKRIPMVESLKSVE